MNVQDKLERILREMHIMVSRGPTLENDSDFVLIHKKDYHLTALDQAFVTELCKAKRAILDGITI